LLTWDQLLTRNQSDGYTSAPQEALGPFDLSMPAECLCGQFFEKEKMMKKAGLIVVAFVLFAFLAGYGFYSSSAADEKSKKGTGEDASGKKSEAKQQNAVVVNGKPIPMSDYQARLEQLNRQVAMVGKKPDDKEMASLKQRVLNDLISIELLKQEAQKKGIKVEDSEVNARIEAAKKKFTPENFQNSLKQANMTESSLKDYFATQIAIGKLVEQEIVSKIVVTPEEVKKFYDSNPDLFKAPEMVRASHILVKVDKNATADEKAKALEKIKGLQKRVKGGEDFAKVAKEASDCPSKENGGDLDFFRKGDMAPAFEQAAFSMKQGEISDIVETEFGYHIIKVTDRKEPGVVSFDEIKSRIEQQLKSDKISQEIPNYVETLKSKSKIEILVKD
jgi:peptidyl-prolyl cis-trans isomerase C